MRRNSYVTLAMAAVALLGLATGIAIQRNAVLWELVVGGLVILACAGYVVVRRQRKLLRELAVSEERFRLLAENSSDVVVLTDVNGIWRYISPAVTQMFGWTPEQLLGQNGLSYVHIDDAAMYAAGTEALAGGRSLIKGSYRMRHKDGHYVWIEAISHVMRDSASGGLVGWVTNARDISTRKRTEQIKDEFISTINHELRTPLTAVLGAVGLALSGKFDPLDAGLRRLLEMARSNGNRLAQLVEDILDFEKVSSGRMQFDLSPQPVDALIEQAVNANRPYAQQFNVSLLVRYRVPGTLVFVDPGRFQQVMANLLSNAAKFSQAGGQVEIDCAVNEGRCRITVTDHGCGIPRAFRASLFDRFAQADGSDRRAKGGTGLGMAIARHMTEAMRGRISFDSEENVGTRFYLDFAVTAATAVPVA